MTKLTFGQKLMILRKNKKLSQKKLAKLLEVGVVNIARYETGVAYPSAQTLIILSDFFEVSIDYLLKDIENDISSLEDKELPGLIFKIDSLDKSDKESLKNMIVSFVETKKNNKENA
jgi:transcriptional regulator with XRE-family HTH domain